MRQVSYCLCPSVGRQHPSNIQNAADLLFTRSVHNYAARHKTHGPRDTPPPSCHNNRVQQFLTLILSGSCYLHYGFLKELWTQRRLPLWLFLWRKTLLGLSTWYFILWIWSGISTNCQCWRQLVGIYMEATTADFPKVMMSKMMSSTHQHCVPPEYEWRINHGNTPLSALDTLQCISWHQHRHGDQGVPLWIVGLVYSLKWLK